MIQKRRNTASREPPPWSEIHCKQRNDALTGNYAEEHQNFEKTNEYAVKTFHYMHKPFKGYMDTLSGLVST